MVKVEKSGVYIKIISPSLERVLKIMNLTVREKLAWFSLMPIKLIFKPYGTFLSQLAAHGLRARNLVLEAT